METQSGKSKQSQKTVTQFPLVLAWSVTAHKFQGQTIKSPTAMVTDLSTMWQPGQSYVALSRVENLQQLYLINCPNYEESRKKFIKACPKATDVAYRVRESAMNLNTLNNRWYESCENRLKLSFFNTRSLKKHFRDLEVDDKIKQADVIGLTETHLISLDASHQYDLEYFPYKSFVHVGKGKGVALYSKTPFESGKDYSEHDCQILKKRVRGVWIILIYRSKNFCLSKLKSKVKPLIMNETQLVKCGDLNFNFESNVFTKFLDDSGFKQVIKHATFLSGSLLDHLYVPKDLNVLYHLHALYDRDHMCIDAIIDL